MFEKKETTPMGSREKALREEKEAALEAAREVTLDSLKSFISDVNGFSYWGNMAIYNIVKTMETNYSPCVKRLSLTQKGYLEELREYCKYLLFEYLDEKKIIKGFVKNCYGFSEFRSVHSVHYTNPVMDVEIYERGEIIPAALVHFQNSRRILSAVQILYLIETSFDEKISKLD